MLRDSHTLALSILRNSAALLVVGTLAKAMGLVIAVLIARFLGPQAMGLFALLFSIAFLVESIAPLGLQDVLVRDVAARPQERVALWKKATLLAAAASLIPSGAFLIAAYFYRHESTIANSLVTLAIGMPFAALANVGQAVLQGLEKVLYLTWTTFLTRIASLVALIVMLLHGAGIEAAFASRVLFQASSAALFVLAIVYRRPAAEHSARTSLALARAMPFAVNRALAELSMRAPLLLLPLLFGLAEIGIFDAADRIRLTLGIMIAVASTAIMPAFARSFAGGESHRHALVSYSAKYVCLAMSIAALGISIFANSIIALLYGQAFSRSGFLLQILVWAQVLVATDAVLKQAMIAHGKEFAVVTRALAGLACLIVLVIVFGAAFGLPGAAAAVLLGAAATLAMDFRFTAREVLKAEIGRLLLQPISCGFIAGGVLLLLDGASPLLRLAAGASTFAIVALTTKLLPGEEREFLKSAIERGLNRRLGSSSNGG